MNTVPAKSPSHNWVENEKKAFERATATDRPDLDLARNEEGEYAGETQALYLGWIARARKVLDDALNAKKE